MAKTKNIVIFISVLALLLSSTTLLLAADRSNVALNSTNDQSIEVLTDQNSQNESAALYDAQISSEDFLLEISLIVIALLSLMISFLLKKSLESRLFIFQWDDHVDI